MMTYYLPHMIEYGLDIQQIRSNPESSYAELIVWYACKLAKEKNVSVNIVDRCGEQLNEHNDPYYKCLKDEFSFVKIEYKNKEGKSLSKGGRVLTTNGQASFESVMDQDASEVGRIIQFCAAMSTFRNSAAVVIDVYRTSVLSAVAVFTVIAHIQCQAVRNQTFVRQR